MDELNRAIAVYYQPASEGVEECISIEVEGGPKRYMRVWPAKPDAGIEWGWRVHESAQQIHP